MRIDFAGPHYPIPHPIELGRVAAPAKERRDGDGSAPAETDQHHHRHHHLLVWRH